MAKRLPSKLPYLLLIPRPLRGGHAAPLLALGPTWYFRVCGINGSNKMTHHFAVRLPLLTPVHMASESRLRGTLFPHTQGLRQVSHISTQPFGPLSFSLTSQSLKKTAI